MVRVTRAMLEIFFIVGQGVMSLLDDTLVIGL
jgi:hypothetical protein